MVAALGHRLHRRPPTPRPGCSATSARPRSWPPACCRPRSAWPCWPRSTPRTGWPSVVGSSLVISLGMAPVFGLTTELIVGSAPLEKAGAASGISETGAELGARSGHLDPRQHRHRHLPRPPRRRPCRPMSRPAAAEAARDTLGAAMRRRPGAACGHGRRPSSRSPPRRSSRGCRPPPRISAVLALGVAGLVLVFLRDAAPPTTEEPVAGEAARPGARARPSPAQPEA